MAATNPEGRSGSPVQEWNTSSSSSQKKPSIYGMAKAKFVPPKTPIMKYGSVARRAESNAEVTGLVKRPGRSSSDELSSREIPAALVCPEYRRKKPSPGFATCGTSFQALWACICNWGRNKLKNRVQHVASDRMLEPTRIDSDDSSDEQNQVEIDGVQLEEDSAVPLQIQTGIENPVAMSMSYRISPSGTFQQGFIVKQWEKGKFLGSGAGGSVFQGITDTGKFFAVKEVSLDKKGIRGRQSITELEQEIYLLSQFRHENIVQYYGMDKDESKLYIFLEFAAQGSLESLYQKCKNIPDSEASAYTRQILHGLKYLHDKDVIHRDIKCANIVVVASGSVKLADFGLAKVTRLNDVKSSKGTPFWMAPEVIKGKKGYGLPADIWSLGCTVLEMLTGKRPYPDSEKFSAIFQIGKGSLPPVPETLSKDARDFIFKCLKFNPEDRPTAAKLLDHPFVTESLPASCN